MKIDIDENIVWEVIINNQNKLTESEALELAKKIRKNVQYIIKD